MKVTLNKVFALDAQSDQAWQLLKNIELVAGCMPGAEITEVTDQNNYKGKVKIKIGPMNLAFNGDIVVKNIDPEKHQIHLIAKGQDSKGSSSASMELSAVIKPTESGASELAGDAEVTVNGKLANFGGRMMTQVSDQILNLFADNFRERLAASATESNETLSAEPEEPKTQEINGLKFAWQALVGLILSLFGKKT